MEPLVSEALAEGLDAAVVAVEVVVELEPLAPAPVEEETNPAMAGPGKVYGAFVSKTCGSPLT